MAQELISKKRLAIVGAGPTGCICAKFLKNAGLDISLFDKEKSFLQTILPTGGGKCNLAYAQYDYKELAKNYPRGEKFLYSVFSRFGTSDTLEFFKSIGVETYTREDNRIYPLSNSSKDVREKLLNSIRGINFIKNETVTSIEKKEDGYKIVTNKSSYFFDIVVIAIGGHSNWDILKHLNINIIEPTQALVGLKTKEDFSSLSGVRVDNVEVKVNNKKFSGDLLFTHKGISGPVIYTISSIYAREEFPYKLSIKLTDANNLQKIFDKNPHKEIINALKELVPKSVGKAILKIANLKEETICANLNKTKRTLIQENLENFTLTITGKIPTGEVVTCGGISLKEVNSKTLEAKNYSDLYFCGEVLDIDGLCGGFNLQNCWSTGYIVSKSIIDKIEN